MAHLQDGASFDAALDSFATGQWTQALVCLRMLIRCFSQSMGHPESEVPEVLNLAVPRSGCNPVVRNLDTDFLWFLNGSHVADACFRMLFAEDMSHDVSNECCSQPYG